MNYSTCKEIEIAVAKHFGILNHIIVPNVSFGFLNYEADLLIVSKSGYAWEIEIKISKSDLLRDAKKRHQHDSDKVRQLWFAIPKKLESCIESIPEKAGVLVIDDVGRVWEKRTPKINPLAKPLTSEEQYKVARLGALRIWSLKEKILKLGGNADIEEQFEEQVQTTLEPTSPPAQYLQQLSMAEAVAAPAPDTAAARARGAE